MRTLAALCLALALPAAAQAAQPAARVAWHNAMMQARPATRGCFKASYPETTWHETTCITAPLTPLIPRRGAPGGARGLTVGDGVDYSAVVSGLITSATGSFPTITGVKKETNFNTKNTYSLQLNTQFFSGSAACAKAAVPGNCLAWQQFAYTTPNAVFMQYWLINYATTCPAGWAAYSTDCYTNSNAVSTAAIPVSELTKVTLLAAASATTDSVGLDTPAGDLVVTNADSKVGLAAVWNTAEFNLFGDGGGSEAKFNKGSTLVVRTEVTGTSTAAPTCDSEGFTGETNNLTLASCTATAGATPAIEFTETNKKVK